MELVVHEGKRVIDNAGTEINALMFNDSIPGPLIICHEGDYVELTLQNPNGNLLGHNIDFHASTGALGGGALTHVQPGEQVLLRWKAIKPGTFIYHCAPGGSMIPYHVVSGMNGAVMVLPRAGLKDRDGGPIRYDKAYYVGEQDYYIPQNADGTFMKYDGPTAGIAVQQMSCRSGARSRRPMWCRMVGSRSAHRRCRHDGHCWRDRPIYPLSSQPGLETAPDRRTWGLRVGAGLIRRSPGPRASDLVHSWGLGRGGHLHVQATGRVCVPDP